MADNIIYSGSGSSVPANTVQKTDDVGGAHVPYVKLLDGTADGTGAIPGDAANGLDVDVTRVQGVVHVDDNSSTLSVDDGGGSLTVDGTVAATQSGTWNVTNVSGTVSLPTGAATAAKQPALGTAGTASADILTVQGITSMTALKVDGSAVTQPVSDGGGSLTVDGTVAVSGTVTVDSELTTADLDTGAGTDTRAVVGMVLAKSGGGQLVSAGQTTMSASMPVTIASDQGAVPASQSGTWNVGTVTTVTNVVHVDDNASTLSIDDGSGSITVDGSVTVTQTTASNLNAAVVGNVASGAADSGNPVKVAGKYNSGGVTLTDGQRGDLQLDASGFIKVNVAAGGGSGGTSSSFGSSFPATGTAIGAKDSSGTNMAALNLDASGFLKVNVAAGGGSGGTSSTFGSADPGTGTAAGFSDGTNMREARVFDADSGAGTQYVLGVNLRKAASGGSVEAATSSDPLRVDPTGTTAQPITDNAGSLTVDNAGTFAVQAAQSGIWNIGTLTTVTNAVHVDDNSGSLTVDVADGTATANLTATSQAATVSSLNGANSAAVQITGTFTATVQFEATVDGSNWFSVNAIVVTTGALVTSATAVGQWQVDVAGFNGFRVRCSAFTSGTAVVTVRTSVTGCAGLALDAPLPTGSNVIGALSANQSVNVAQLAGTTTDTNSGNKSAGTLRVVLATDQPQLTNKLLVTPDANSAVNVAQLNGVAVTMNNGVTGTGVQRVTLASDSTGNIATIGTSVTPGTGATNLGKAEDAAHTSGDVGVLALAVRQDTLANSTSTDGDYGAIKLTTAGRVYTSATVDAALPAGTNTIGKVGIDASAAVGGSIQRVKAAAASTNATSTKASAGVVTGWSFTNNTASAKYVKFYNKATAPTVGTDTPLFTEIIPASGGNNLGGVCVPFSTGIAFAITGGIGDADATNTAVDDVHGFFTYA
jgi:hypothetical protein